MGADLLFVQESIFWWGNIPYWGYIVVIFFASFFAWWYTRRAFPRVQDPIPTRPRAPVKLHVPDTQDAGFEEHSLHVLKEYVSFRYAPKNSQAHTEQDILSYCTDTALIELWKTLEHAIYSGDHLPLSQKESIARTLSDRIG